MKKEDRSDQNNAPLNIGPKELVAMPAKEALDVIMASLTPAHLVQALSPEDLYFLVHDVGVEASLPVLARASNEQWQFMLDVDLWERDLLDNDATHIWLDLLMRADLERAVIWAMTENPELVSLHLFRNIQVRMKEHDESPSDFGDDYFSLDDVFYIRILNEKFSETLKKFLHRLADLDISTFHEVLSHLAGIMPAETEESLFHMRSVRMSEKGFLPFNEAVAIYQHLTPDDVLGKKPKRLPETQKQDTTDTPLVPVATTLALDDQTLFQLALNALDDWDVLEKLQREFAGMCNQIMSADHHMARSKEDLAAVVRKACSYLDVGLEKLGGRIPEEMAGLLEQIPLTQIFRVGYGAALELKWRTHRWFRESWCHARDMDFSFWEDTWAGLLQGLLEERPLFYVGFSKEGNAYREFQSAEEITRTHDALDQIVALDHFFSYLFPEPRSVEPRKETYQPVTYKNLLLTAWMQHTMDLGNDSIGITQTQLVAFFPNLWEGDKKIGATTREAFLSWIGQHSDRSASDMHVQEKEVFQSLLDELERDYGAVVADNLDPRYIEHFLVVV